MNNNQWIGVCFFNSANEFCIIKSVDNFYAYIHMEPEDGTYYKIMVDNIPKHFASGRYKMATEVDRLLYV